MVKWAVENLVSLKHKNLKVYKDITDTTIARH